MFDEIDGLPLHPLAVHAPVVLIPLTALVALVYVVVPPLRRHLSIWLVLFSVGAAGASFVAVQSGEALRDEKGTNPDIERHEEFGEKVLYLACVLAVVVIVLVLIDFALRARRARIARLEAERAAALTPVVVSPAVESKSEVREKVDEQKSNAKDADSTDAKAEKAEKVDESERAKASEPRDEPVATAPAPVSSSSVVLLRAVSVALSIVLLAVTVAVVVFVVNAGDSGARMVW